MNKFLTLKNFSILFSFLMKLCLYSNSLLFYSDSQNATFKTQSILLITLSYIRSGMSVQKKIHLEIRILKIHMKFETLITSHISMLLYLWSQPGILQKERLRRVFGHIVSLGNWSQEARKGRETQGRKDSQFSQSPTWQLGLKGQWKLHRRHLRTVCGKHKSREYLYMASISPLVQDSPKNVKYRSLQVHT